MPNELRTTPKNKHNAISLRHNPTPAESKLWSRLRNDQLGVSFRRQHAIGPFITDFCCIQLKLVVELDGGQHLDREEYDQQRTEYLEARGYKVIRFWNNEVMHNINSVINTISQYLPL